MDFKVGDIVRKNVPGGYEMRVTVVTKDSLVGVITRSGFVHPDCLGGSPGKTTAASKDSYEIVQPSFDAKALADEYRASRKRQKEILEVMRREGFSFRVDPSKKEIDCFVRSVEEKV